MGTMPGMIGLSTMAVGLATASGHRGNGTRLEVTELKEFLQEMATAVEQFGQRLGHEELQVMIEPIILTYYILEDRGHKKRIPPNPHF
jgi:hypothetical protein